jgi:zinc protease
MNKPSDSASLHISFVEHNLANGLHVILHEDRHLPIVAINLWYHVGSKNEREGRTGFAHLFEHMMFQGSENVPPNGHFRYVQQAGGTLNGSTSFDRTNYFETLPAHRLELGLWLESDRMLSLAVNEQTLETQRSVVMEERRSRYDNQPYGTIYEELFSRAYKLQPYRWSTIGSMKDIREARLDEVREFHSMYYRPGNAVLCIAGDIDATKALDLVEKYFGGIPDPGTDIYRPFVREPRQLVPVRDYMYDNVPLPAVVIASHIPEIDSADYTPLDLLSLILASGDSSRLYQSLIYRHRTAQSVSCFALGLELPGLFIVEATARQDGAAEEMERLLREVLDRIATDGITEDELEKARNGSEAALIGELATMQSRADLLNSCHVLFGDASRINTEPDRIRAVTRDDIRRVAAEYLRESNSTVLYCLPNPKEPASA